jgi:redox-sensitive bicupin YhaK (pirin superfamily)
VTVVRRGLIDHADSLGAAARYGGGDVQWLTAGKGIIHSEMFPLLNRTGPNALELFQIWLNLARDDKAAEPHFSMFWDSAVPRHTARDPEGRRTEVTIVAGCIEEQHAPLPPPDSWASRPESDVAIWTVTMEPGARWTLPAASPGSHRRLYFFRGSGLRVAGRAIERSHAIDLRSDVAVSLEAGPDGSELLLLQGRPIREPVAQYGPFVMNTREEIAQTFAEYQRTGFGGWPWKSDDPIPPREEGRFARHADGRREQPA